MAEDLPADQKDAKAREITYYKLDSSRGHELNFLKAVVEGQAFQGAR